MPDSKKPKPDPKGKPKGDGKKNGHAVANWASEYGWSRAFLKSHPALEDIFQKAINNSWSPARFVAEVQDTPWFKKHSDTWRQATYLEATDPTTYKQRIGTVREQIANMAGQLGIEVSGKTLTAWSEQAFRFGWTQDQINNHLASALSITDSHSTTGGDIANVEEKLRSAAMNNGVVVNQQTMQTWLREIVRGNSTVEEYQNYITKQAVAAHPNWRRELEGGMSVADIAEPYRAQMAQLLEVNPADIDIRDRMLTSALTNRPDGGNDFTAMSMTDFGDTVRKDPRWMQTDNAKEQFMNTGSSILRMFGLAG